MEGSEVKPQVENQIPHYDLIVPVGFVPRAARVANSIVTQEIREGKRSEVIEPGTIEDITGKFQTALNVGTTEKRSVVFPMNEEELNDFVNRCSKLAENEHDPLKAGEIRDVVRRLTEQFEEAKNPPEKKTKESSKFGIESLRAWFSGRTGHGKFD